MFGAYHPGWKNKYVWPCLGLVDKRGVTHEAWFS